MKQEILLDIEGARVVAERLLEAFESNYGIFEDTSGLLEFQIPDGVNELLRTGVTQNRNKQIPAFFLHHLGTHGVFRSSLNLCNVFP